MIKYTVKNRRIEITYDTGYEMSILKKFLEIIDKINEMKT